MVCKATIIQHKMSALFGEEEDYSFVTKDLHNLVLHGRSNELDQYVHKKPYTSRLLTEWFQNGNEYFTLLMLAALNGHEEVIRLILSHCLNAVELVQLVESEGYVYSITGDLVEDVTALWCALDRGHYKVAHMLIDLGRADVHHGPLHPLLIDATISGRFDTVHFLIENGYADVNRTFTNDENKSTSLLLAAEQDNTQIIAYLINRGADIDYATDLERNTPLICATKRSHLASIKLLCSLGASPNLRNNQGETALMLAAWNNRSDAINILLDSHCDETSLNDLELVASSYMISTNNVAQAEVQWVVRLLQQSLRRRKLLDLAKAICQPIVAYDFKQECQSIDELNVIQNDVDRLWIEALLIRERILLPENNPTLFPPLLKRGETLVSLGQYDHCLHLWLHAFYLQQQMEVNTDLQPFIWVLCQMIINQVDIPGEDFLQISRLTLESSQKTSNVNHMRNALFLVAIAGQLLEQETMSLKIRHSIIQWIRQLCRLQRTTQSEQTLLHLSVDQQTNFCIQERWEDIESVLTFPDITTVRLLLDYGKRWIDLDAIDPIRGDTALHIISHQSKGNNTNAIIQLLIDAGAHPDCVNVYGQIPFDIATNNETRTLLRSFMTPPRLKCLCARQITDQQLLYEHIWPDQTPMNTFLRLHGALAKEHSISDDSDNYFHDYNSDESIYL